MRRTSTPQRALAFAALGCLVGLAAIIAPVAGFAHAAPSTAAASTAAAKSNQYVVKTGDNLVGIANKLDVRLSDLLRANSLTLDSPIHPGDVLAVPARAGATQPSAAQPSTGQPASATAAAATTYVVKTGDALSSIASRFGVKLGALLKANKLTIDSVVHPGMTLTIPAGGALSASPTHAASGPENSADSTASKIELVIAFATAQIGKPYEFNTAGPDTFDCSGLTAASYREVGLWLPHQSAMQSNRGVAVDWTAEPIRAGDLVFMYTKDQPAVISHVGLAIDANRWIHAPRTGDVVRMGLIPQSKIVAVRRYITE
jgi:cell wall-associated NlpC family hydrolase